MEDKEYQDIFRQSPISIEYYDSFGSLKDANQSCIDLFGLQSIDSIKGFNLFTNLHLSEQANIDIRVGKAVRYETMYDFDQIKRLKTYETSKEGVSFLECYINPTVNDEKEVTGYIVHTIEITERHQIADSLFRSEEQYRMLLDVTAIQKSEEKLSKIVNSSINGMYFYHLNANEQLIFIGANPAADKIIGISHELLIGKTIEEAFPELANTDVPELYKNIARGEAGTQTFDIEYNDTVVSGFYQVQAFQTEQNSITVHFTDISERKKAELLLEQQSNELQRINATKDKFLSIIAHDLKNPFNAIIGFSDLMIQNFNELDDETFLQGLNTIETASKHAYKLLENLLVWSQNQTGRSPFNPEILNLNTQVAESFKMIESSAEIKGISVSISIKKATTIFADKNMLDSILRNLILNAIKFSYQGGKVKISAFEKENEIQVSVKDSGVGISSENQNAIFKIDKHTITLGTNNEQGTGLGLILCKDFVTRHNGTIWVESTPGSGSTFTFSLPLK